MGYIHHCGSQPFTILCGADIDRASLVGVRTAVTLEAIPVPVFVCIGGTKTTSTSTF